MIIKLQNLQIAYPDWNVLIKVENEMVSEEPKHPMHTDIVKINQTITKNIVEHFVVVEQESDSQLF